MSVPYTLVRQGETHSGYCPTGSTHPWLVSLLECQGINDFCCALSWTHTKYDKRTTANRLNDLLAPGHTQSMTKGQQQTE
jgi:hypothetical protein